MNWLHYLLEANIYLAVFYVLYFVLFTRDTHYRLARIYLLTTCVLSYLIPLVQISWLMPDTGRQTVAIIPNGHLINGQDTAIETNLSFDQIMVYAYAAGVAVMTMIFLFKLVQLFRLTRNAGHSLDNKYKLIKLEDSNAAFSFFNYLFIGTRVNGAETVVRHELVHITQKHSLDIVFLELIKTISWFNPFIYLLERSLKTVHEYIADEQTAAYENDALAYSSFLVNNAYGLGGSSLTHSFFNYNLLKKRIIMLNQKRSGKLARLKYLTALPVCGALLCVSTLGFSKNYGWINIGALQQDTTKKLPPPPPPMPPAVSDQKTISDNMLKLPPPPPAPPKGSKKAAYKMIADDKNGKPVVMSDMKTVADDQQKMKVLADVKVSKVSTDMNKLPPPPPPADPFEAFYKYVGKHVKYPAKDRDNLVAGRVIITFNVVNNKITDAKIVRGVETMMDEEALRVVNNYLDPLPGNMTITHYALPVSFAIQDSKGNYVGNSPKSSGKSDADKPVTQFDQNKAYMLNEVVVIAYAPEK